MKVKITSRGLTVDGKLYPAWLSFYRTSALTPNGSGEDPHVSVSCKGYVGFPDGVAEALGVEVANHTDTMTDYFDHDRFVVRRGHPRFAEALGAYLKKERSYLTRREKRGTPAPRTADTRAQLDDIERKHYWSARVARYWPETTHRKLRGAQDSFRAHVTEPASVTHDCSGCYQCAEGEECEFPLERPVAADKVGTEPQVEFLRWLGVES